MVNLSSRVVLQFAGVNALLVSNLVNIRYLTGLELSAGFVLVRPKCMTLFVDDRYYEMAEKKLAKNTNIIIRPYNDVIRTMKRITTCGFEASSVTVAVLKQWKKAFKNTKFVQKNNCIEHFRRSKQADELRLFRKSQTITQVLHREIAEWLVPGVKEQQVAWKLAERARELGADSLSFDPIVAFGTHTSRPHHHPTNRSLRKGQLVQIDVGVKYKGYCSDQSRVLFTGSPTSKQQRTYDALLETKQFVEQAVRPGVTTHELDTIAREHLQTYNMDRFFTHALGHGVGLEIHEGVSLSKRSDAEELLKNEIVTIEPGVYYPGQFGMRIEDEIIVQ